MKVGDLNKGMLLLPAPGFGIIITEKKLLRFIRWISGNTTTEPMIYLGRKQRDAKSRGRLHEVMFKGDISYIDSFDFRYVNNIN